MATNESVSQLYARKPYLYWWDVWDRRVDAIRRVGQLVLIQKDTGRKAVIPAAVLLPLLTEARRTTRCQHRPEGGRWGLYVRPNKLDQIEIEGGTAAPAYLKVEWV